MIDIATIEQHLSAQGRFCLIDWLLADSQLFYTDYEAWRYGQRENLDEVLQLNDEALQALIEDTDQHCLALGLAAESQDFYRWDGDQRVVLTVSEDEQLNQQLSQRWMRPQDQPQLDLFMDNSAQMAESALLEALGGRQFDSAQTLLQNLSELNPECTRLGGYQDLINYGLHMAANPHIDLEAVDAELQGLKQEVLPLAQEVLNQVARDYLSYAWRRLANSLNDHPFDSDHPELHTSFALMEVPDYPAAVSCLKVDPQLYQQPLLLERLAHSYNALHQDEQALVIWCLLMELDLDFAERALDRSRSHKVHTFWQDFWEVSDDWSLGLFPAYLLARRPSLAHYLKEFPPLELPASKAMVGLIEQKLNQADEIPARKAVNAVSPELLSVYLGRR